MTDKENRMIEDFFKQAAQQQIEDNGFTERVMKNCLTESLRWQDGCHSCGRCSAWW